MSFTKKSGNILFFLTLISPMVSFYLASEIGEADIFGVAGIVRYSWIMLLFIPIGILSIVIGLILKKSNQKYMRNFVIAFVCLPLLLIFGSYRFMFTDISYDADKIFVIENRINLELPHEIKIATTDLGQYNVSYAKIIDEKDKNTFEYQLASNNLWQKELSVDIKELLPLNIQYEAETFDYFVFYNIYSEKYNTYPTEVECECIYIAYDCKLQRLFILDNYKINVR